MQKAGVSTIRDICCVDQSRWFITMETKSGQETVQRNIKC
jgi:hypothetical protein